MKPITIQDGDIRLNIYDTPMDNPGRINITLQQYERRRAWEGGDTWVPYQAFQNCIQLREKDLQVILDLFARARDLMMLL